MAANIREDDSVFHDEFDLLASIFCLDGESCDVKTTFPNPVISVTQRVGQIRLDNYDHDLAVDKNNESTLCLSFELSPEYPFEIPSNISVQCSNIAFTRSSTSNVSDLLKDEAQTLIGKTKLHMSH